MAQKSGNKRSKAELTQQIAHSREEITRRLSRVREEADLPRKIRRSIRREPVPWIVGAIAVGLLVTVMVTRKKKIIVDAARATTKSKHPLLEAGFLLGALRVAATLLKPMVVKLIEEKFGHYSMRGRSGPKGF
jgi:hypothetical protein